MDVLMSDPEVGKNKGGEHGNKNKAIKKID
jgi:hypothetical protein